MNLSTLLRPAATAVLGGVLLVACGGGGGGGASPQDVRVSWDANRETAVNSPGGGYTVFYSQRSGFAPGEDGVEARTVPFDSDRGTTPTEVILSELEPGTWYIRVRAFSSLDPPGPADTATSTASPQIQVNVPG